MKFPKNIDMSLELGLLVASASSPSRLRFSKAQKRRTSN
jgi:hypothetical protein